jgi:hypothetical protein
MEQLNWVFLAIVIMVPVALLFVLFLFLRTCYKKRGWKGVRLGVMLAVLTFILILVLYQVVRAPKL